MSTVDEILGEFIDAWKAGGRPDPDAYLERVAAGDRDELAAGIAAWLGIAPTPDYPPPARAAISAEPAMRAALRAAEALRPPLPESLPVLRERAGLGIRDVAARLAERFRLDDRDRTVAYLEELERGELDAGRLSHRLVDALSEMLGAVRIALPSPPAPAAPSQAFFRADEEAEDWIVQDIDALSRAALAAAPAPMDELDRLFLGGPDA
jgi:hypothetical protein